MVTHRVMMITFLIFQGVSAEDLSIKKTAADAGLHVSAAGHPRWARSAWLRWTHETFEP